MGKFFRKHWFEMVFGLIFVVGIGLLSYPTVSNWWNERHTTGVVNDYDSMISNMDANVIQQDLVMANMYNDRLVGNPDRLAPDDAFMEEYMRQLDPGGTGVMGYIEIPVISVKLPIYHTVEEKYLQVGVGHQQGTSLPVGGVGTNCFLSGHRGLPSSKLFTDLDKVQIGDIFRITTLGQVLTYQVDKIDIVLPDDTAEAIRIQPDRDLVTLVTCTPYGVNTHRLLVRGTRIETRDYGHGALTGDADIVNSVVQSLVITAILCAFMTGAVLVVRKIRYG